MNVLNMCVGITFDPRAPRNQDGTVGVDEAMETCEEEI